MVDNLRQSGRLLISLVAEVRGGIAGHIAFSPIDSGASNRGVGLAPLAVRPEYQKQGIGTALVRRGLEECTRHGFGFCVVLGDPAYYCRFGFLPASRWQLYDEFGGGDAFQVIEFQASTIPCSGGRVRYCSEFSIFSEGGSDSIVTQ